MENELSEPEKVRCPKCHSTQITAEKHGFSAGKAVGGALLTGSIGVLAGLHGSKKIEITCLNCGHKFKPGQHAEGKKEAVAKQPQAPEKLTPLGCLFLIVIFAGLAYFLGKGC